MKGPLPFRLPLLALLPPLLLGGILLASGAPDEPSAATGAAAAADAAEDRAAIGYRRAAVFLSGLVYWLGVWVQIRRIRRRIGRAPNLKPRGRKERLLWLGWGTVMVVWIGQPLLALERHGAGSPFALFPPLLHPATAIAGTALAVLGCLGTLWCYVVMGSSWRIGVKESDRTALVKAGPFRLVRHPIYTFQILMLASAALLLPTAASLVILVLHVVCVRIKALDEERHLLGQHGESYRRYLDESGRFCPPCCRRPAGAGDADQPS